MKTRTFPTRILLVLWTLTCFLLTACSSHPDESNQGKSISPDSIEIPATSTHSAPDTALEKLSIQETPISGEMLCFENTNKEEIEEYLYFEINGDSIHGRYDGYHEEIGYYYNDFFGKITSPGKAEVTILTDIEYDNEEITGNIWEYSSDRLHVLKGDRGTVGPYDYSAIPCAEKKQKVKELQKN